METITNTMLSLWGFLNLIFKIKLHSHEKCLLPSGGERKIGSICPNIENQLYIL